jgi:hypothetical protein
MLSSLWNVWLWWSWRKNLCIAQPVKAMSKTFFRDKKRARLRRYSIQRPQISIYLRENAHSWRGRIFRFRESMYYASLFSSFGYIPLIKDIGRVFGIITKVGTTKHLVQWQAVFWYPIRRSGSAALPLHRVYTPCYKITTPEVKTFWKYRPQQATIEFLTRRWRLRGLLCCDAV